MRVGTLSGLVDGRYAFAYTDDVHAVADFHPLTQFPDLDRTYVSTGLPAFFANRLMNRKRDSFPVYLHALGIDSPDLDTPMELLARTGGTRATDTFHLVDDLLTDTEGGVTSHFLALGARVSRIADRQCLQLRLEPDDPVSARGQLICVDTGDPVGCVPDRLLADLEKLQARTSELEIFAERVTPDAPPHLRLLCRIEARVLHPA